MLQGGTVGLLFAAREAPGDVRKLQESQVVNLSTTRTKTSFLCLLFSCQYKSFDYPVCLVQICLSAVGLLLFEAGRVSAIEVLFDAPVELNNSACYST